MEKALVALSMRVLKTDEDCIITEPISILIPWKLKGAEITVVGTIVISVGPSDDALIDLLPNVTRLDGGIKPRRVDA